MQRIQTVHCAAQGELIQNTQTVFLWDVGRWRFSCALGRTEVGASAARMRSY